MPAPLSQANIAPLAVTPIVAAKMLSVGVGTLYNMLRSGAIESYHDGSRIRRIPVRSLEAYIARRLADGNVADAATLRRVRRRDKGA